MNEAGGKVTRSFQSAQYSTAILNEFAPQHWCNHLTMWLS